MVHKVEYVWTVKVALGRWTTTLSVQVFCLKLNVEWKKLSWAPRKYFTLYNGVVKVCNSVQFMIQSCCIFNGYFW